MSLNQLLWKIPTDFTQKYDFPELQFLAAYLKSEKDIITQIDSTVHSLEKGYKSIATSYSQTVVKKSSYAVSSTEDALFRNFIDTHNKLTEKFNRFGTSLSMLRSTKSAPLVEAYNNNYKSMSSELIKLKSIITEPIDQLQAARKSYDQYLPKLLTLTTAISHNQVSISSINQQLPKALAAVDSKLQRVQQNYLAFRAKFLEYCQARDAVFIQVEMLLHDSTIEIKKILNEASGIDKEMFEESDFKDLVRDKEFVVVEPTFWKKNEAAAAATMKKKTTNKFVVTVDRTIEVDGVHTITPNEVYTVLDAMGDEWMIQDKSGQSWHVPSEFLVPLH